MSFATFLQGVSPFGPIFGKELRTTARRKRTYLLRVIYMGVLLFALFMAYMVTDSMGRYSGGVAMRNQQQSLLGQYFFGGYAVCSVVMMGMLGPILTATAISSERLHKTLPVLLMTPITAWQIVAGKLFSRTFVALTLIALGLPVLALVRLLGGVELTQMFWAVALAIVAAVSSAAIGLFFSTLLNRAYAVIILSFGAMFFLYTFVPFIVALMLNHVHSPGGQMNAIRLICAINPYFMVNMVAWPSLGMGMRGGFAPPLGWCIGLHLAMTALLLICSAMLLRRHARRAGEVATGEVGTAMFQPPLSLPLPIPVGPAQSSPPPLPLPGAAPPALPPIPLAYQPVPVAASRRARVVADNPILWRELRRPLLARRWQKIVASALCVGLVSLVYLLMADSHELSRSRSQSGWAIVFNFLFGGLVSIIASTAVAQERDSDTWTLLLATPISGYTIVWGKAVGVMRRMLWPMVFIAAHFLIFALFGVISIWSAFIAVWIILTFNAIWLATGIYFSLRFSKTTLAVIVNLALPVIAYGLVFVVLGLFGEMYDSLWSDNDLHNQYILPLNGGILIAFIAAAALWVLSVYLAIRRARGAMGMLIVATLCLMTTGVMFGVTMNCIPRDEPSEQVGWYVPYYFLSQIGRDASQSFTLPDRWGSYSRFGYGNVYGYFYGYEYAVVLAIGLLHLLGASLLLTLAGSKFSALVGRARQLKRLKPAELSPLPSLAS